MVAGGEKTTAGTGGKADTVDGAVVESEGEDITTGAVSKRACGRVDAVIGWIAGGGGN